MDDRPASASRKTAGAVALIALAVAGITAAIYMLDPPRAKVAKAAPKTSKPPAARIESGVVLLMDETLVVPPPEAKASAAPAQKAPEKYPAKPATKAKHAPTTPHYAKRPPSPTLASASQYTRDEGRSRHMRNSCVTCARVVGISEYPTFWEMRVRFNDGSRDALTYRERPPFEIGDPVRVEHGQVLRD